MNLLEQSKRVLSLILCAVIITASNAMCLTVFAENGYIIESGDSGITCKFNEEYQKDVYLYISNTDGVYAVSDENDAAAVLYYFDADANGTAFSGKYSGRKYRNGELLNEWKKSGKKTYYYRDGVRVKGINKIDGKVYYFDKKGVKYTGSGWKTISDKKYYFSKGVAKKGWTMIDKSCYHFSSMGELSVNKKIDGLKVDKNGKASGSAKKYVPLYAKLLVKSITKPSQTKSEKLRICFDYLLKNYRSTGNPRIPHYTEKDWVYVYANDMFGERGGGNCMSYAAAFAFLAKECGYDKVYGCNSGGHAWTEVNGKVYDPEQYKDVGKKIYGWKYSNSKISNYKPAIADYKKQPWKHVKIK